MSTIVEPLSAETPYQAEKPIFGGSSNIKKTMKIAIGLFATACKKFCLNWNCLVPGASEFFGMAANDLPVLDSREFDLDGFASDVWV